MRLHTSVLWPISDEVGLYTIAYNVGYYREVYDFYAYRRRKGVCLRRVEMFKTR